MAKILVVDDEFGIGDMLHDLLNDEGHEVLLAIHGRQGLEVMRQAQPALVLLDFMMPVLDGAGVLQAMMADPKLAQTPVILMTALPESTVQNRTHGYTHYVRKPFRIDNILELVSVTLAENKTENKVL